jgi:peptidoglycan/LPS O-acetylase OafA/YrhL
MHTLQQNPARTYYPGLDTLRGVAILVVLGYHIFPLVPFFHYGWLGVDLFFVISGFLITDILLKSSDSKGQIWKFYGRRILRIFPVYYISLILFIFRLPESTKVPYDVGYYHQYQAWFWLYLENWLFIFRHPEQSTFLNHFWSLAVEEQFYIFWPWVVLFAGNSKKLLKIIIVLLLFVIVSRTVAGYLLAGKINFESLHKFSRIDGICIGSALAVYLHRNSRFPLPLAIRILAGLVAAHLLYFISGCFLHIDDNYFPVLGYTSFSILFALIIAVLVTNKGIGEFVNQKSRMLSFVGKISYGLYIYHWPIYLLFAAQLRLYITDTVYISDSSATVITGVMLILASVLLSTISYFSLEKYFLSIKTRLR